MWKHELHRLGTPGQTDVRLCEQMDGQIEANAQVAFWTLVLKMDGQMDFPALKTEHIRLRCSRPRAVSIVIHVMPDRHTQV